jgi:hypothetical protein
MAGLVLGPLLRHVDETSATIWVETDGPARVRVSYDGPTGGHAEVPTFRVHGHHYALVCVEGLEPGCHHPYTVEVDGTQVWPEPGSDLPPSVIPTLDHGKPLRLAYGSCRTSVGHRKGDNDVHGIDALRAYALRMAGQTPREADDPDGGTPRWPDLVVFLGDQVYADETTQEMVEFIASRRSLEEPPGKELKDYEEYAHIYWLAWRDPVNRWLLSTVPTLMIFDDHDVRDDWNTSRAWKDTMEATSWWHDRIVAGLASYWVYQHAGNLTPAQLADDEVWGEIVAHRDDPSYDAGPMLDRLAARVDADPTCYRWSYARELGTQARLVVIDSRAARVVDPDARDILDADEKAWVDGQVRGDVDHLLIATSLPYLLAEGLHYVEAASEVLAGGGFGRRLVGVGEWVRQTVDLEHWAAFQAGFRSVAEMVLETGRGERGRPPATITFLSGDVHHSYLAAVKPLEGVHSRIMQAVCSPIRNPLSRKWRFATAALAYGIAGPLGQVLRRSRRVPDAPFEWRIVEGPWFDNNLATLEVRGRGLRMWWATGRPGTEVDRPRLVRATDVSVDC